VELVLAAVFAAAAPLAFAVDPTLHDNPEVLPDSAPAIVEPEDDATGLDVREIHDLGTKPIAGTTPDVPTDLWQRIRNGFSLPNLDTPLVAEREAWYAQRPQQIKIFVDRSRRYLFHIVEELERRKLPTELAFLPMVESAYNPMAYSRAHASGLWQFIPSTGKNYNLDQTWWYDARRDILASTDAALDYLQMLHGMFGDWHLALAAYNWGENGVMRAIERNRAKGLGTDYLSLPAPNETRRYVPTFQALKNIFANPAAFGIELDPIPNAPYFVTVTLTRDVDLRVAAKLAEMPIEELVALNPGHNRPVVASDVAPQLVLPADRAEVFMQNLESHDKPLSSWRTYTFKAGDKLERLAAQHGVTVARLKAVNGARANGHIPAGTQLLLPQRGSAAAVEPLPPIFTPPASLSARIVSYIVKRGDTWASIARMLGVRIEELTRANGGTRLTAGERLTVEIKGRTTAQKASSYRASAPSTRTSAASTSTRRSAPAVKTR
jgi:membrane-bound lytic murein transglycosylase D